MLGHVPRASREPSDLQLILSLWLLLSITDTMRDALVCSPWQLARTDGRSLSTLDLLTMDDSSDISMLACRCEFCAAHVVRSYDSADSDDDCQPASMHE